MRDEDRKQIQALIDAVIDPAVKAHYQKQFAAADTLEQEGLGERLPLEPVLRRRDEPPIFSRTYVFQWFRARDAETLLGEKEELCEQLVVHTAGTEKALALFEQNAAAGALVHAETVVPRCEILSLDADDCRTCFGAGKLTKDGKQRAVDCNECGGSGKRKRRFG